MADQSVFVIEAGRTERHYWRDLWRYRELFFFLAWRDILVRYKQTVIGIVWALGIYMGVPKMRIGERKCNLLELKHINFMSKK